MHARLSVGLAHFDSYFVCTRDIIGPEIIGLF